MKRIIEKFNHENVINEGKDTKPYIILFDGTIGSGKSTVISLINELINVKVLSNDKIRNYILNEYPNIAFEEREKLVKEIQYPRIKEALKKNNICILDGDISGNFDKKIKRIKEIGYPYYIVRLKCNQEVNKARVINRKRVLKNGLEIDDSTSCSLADIEEYTYESEKKNELDDNLIFFEINTSGSIESIKKQVIDLVYKLLVNNMQVISINNDNISNDGKFFIKKTSIKELTNLKLIYQKLNGTKININNKKYTFKIPKIYSFKDNKIKMEYIKANNLEIMLRNSKTHKEGVIILNSILKFLLQNNIYWFDFAPRNILINDSDIILVDFERDLILDSISLTDYFKDIVFEEYSAFLTDSERIINEDDIYSGELKLPAKYSKRVEKILELKGIKSVDSVSYYNIIKDILKRERPYYDNNILVFPIIYLEKMLIDKGYDKYAKEILEGDKMRKEYKPFSNVKGFYINEGFFQSDTGLNLELRPGGYIPKSGLIYNTVLSDCKDKTVLDLGCGDLGILGLLARQNGAKSIDSVDIDPACVAWLNKLIKDNKFDNVTCYLSDNFDNIKKSYDIILTNLAQMPMIEGSIHDSGGIDGRENIIKILKQSKHFLNEFGYLYMLLFDFLGVDKRLNDDKSIEEIAHDEGYKDMEIVESVDKIITPGSVTYDSISHINNVYPKYSFNTTNDGKPYCKILISRFKK